MSPAASTRWCPTPEQVMILEEMYRSGVRTPNAAQIQQITAHLSLYGKIEGKNVFYWFQNHKARDRQKLRKKLLGKQLQQHQQQQQQQMMFSHHIFPTFDPHHHNQHFHHYSNPNNQSNLLHHLHFDQPPPPSALPLPPPPPLPPLCCGPTSSSLGLFHHQQLPSVSPSPSYFAAHQTRAEDLLPQMANTWKMDASEPKYASRDNTKPMMRMLTNDHDHDWMMMMKRPVGDHHHHHHYRDNHDVENSSTRPIKTLEH